MFWSFSEPLTQRDRQQRLTYLAIALAPLIGSVLYNLGFRLPFLKGCPFLRYTGIPCPGWGMTRSFMAIARGDWQQALNYHLLAPLVFAGFLMATIHLLVELFCNQKIHTAYGAIARSPKAQTLAFLVLLGYHSTRLYTLAQSGELLVSFMQSPLGLWLN
ncbi:MAG: DUF2752 domain-containing protein [Elainellaceae cyanobacterium]